MTETHDEVVAAVGTDMIDKCVRLLLEWVTNSNLFDRTAGNLAVARGACDYDFEEPTGADEVAYDVAFFDVLDVTLTRLHSTWSGHYDTQKLKLSIRCDVVHPKSGEVLAEQGDVLDVHTPRGQHVLAVAWAYPNYYEVYPTTFGSTAIAACK